MPSPTAADWKAAVHPDATTLSPTRSEVVAFDLDGRPSSWFRDGLTFKRSLASEVVGRRTVDGVRQRWRVPAVEALAAFAQVHEVASAALAALHAGGLQPSAAVALARPSAVDADAAPAPAPAPEAIAAELDVRLRRTLAWTPERLAAERARFDGAYAPIPILPPDQYGAIVLQATFGCSWNRCTFCSFYQDRPFQVRSPEAFGAHVDAVATLLGRAADARRSVFLADGNALVLANARLRPILEAARGAFPGRPFAGFVDVFGGERKGVDDWRELRALGLERVAIGVETGHDALLAWLNKPGSADEAAAFVADLKRAGLRVAVILMVGVGGARFADAHVDASARLLERLALDAGDVVYLSPFVVHASSTYAERASAEGVTPLDAAARTAQYAALRSAARAAAPRTPVARYDIGEFVY